LDDKRSENNRRNGRENRMEIETWKQNLLLFRERESTYAWHLRVCTEGIEKEQESLMRRANDRKMR
jgi:hypothetical protein